LPLSKNLIGVGKIALNTMLLIQVGSSLVSIGVGVAIFRGWRGGSVLDRLGVASLPFTVSVVLWRWIADVGFRGVVPYWSGARLAAAMTVQRGNSLYSPATSGPVLGWIYPPISALAYLPATFLPDPALAIVAGRCLSLFYYYAPAALVLSSVGSDRRGRPKFGRLLLFLTFALISGESRPLVYSSTEVHADAPALGLAALAVYMVTRSRGGRDPWACAGSLLLAMLSVWAKQLTIPIFLIVLPAWILATGGPRRFGLFVLAAAVGAIGISLLMLVAFEHASMGFNIWTVPSHHPWRIGWSSEVTSTLVRLQREHLGLLILLAVGSLGRVALLPGGTAPGPSLRSDAWPLFLAAALAELPLSVMGYFKVGGAENSLSFCLYFLALGGILLYEPLMVAPPSAEGDGRERASWSWLLVIGLNLTLSLVNHQMLGLALNTNDPAWREGRAAEQYLRKHRGEVYFPWNPLMHLAVEGESYHFEYGVFDRNLAGFHVRDDHFLRHIPPRTRLVCYPKSLAWADKLTLNYLKGFREVEVAELPGWECYARPRYSGGAAPERGGGSLECPPGL